MPLAAGTQFADRFQVESPAGHGGMGTVYRALDQKTGRLVALKLIQAEDAQQEVERFLREGQILASLRHPGIVEYVTHGVAPPGLPYLVMEWLEGLDLAQRLRRGRLSPAALLRLLVRVAQALAAAHERGIVHRDLKPSNLFLRGGEVDQVALLDFGIARQGTVPRAMTRTGVLLGTPEYMAPEQARGERKLGPAADLFALGCVAFECLVGHPPFTAEHVTAVLAKILFEEAPRLSSRLPGVPQPLDDLIARLLLKDPARRPRDAQALLTELAAIGEIPESVEYERSHTQARTLPLRAVTPELAHTATEHHLVCVLLAVPGLTDGAATGETPAPAAPVTSPVPTTAAPSPATGPTVRTMRIEELRAALSEHEVIVEPLADGALVVTLDSVRSAPVLQSATDLASQAARCALLIKRLWPGASIALVTGRARLSERIPVGEALNRAGTMLGPRDPVVPAATASIVLDEVTAGLLDARFAVERRTDGRIELRSEDLATDASRPLLGRPTPCVGREHELGILEGALAACIEEAAPRAVLITSAPGGGKSRLRHEFLRRIAARGEPITVLLGRGDPMGAAWSHDLLGQPLRRLCDVPDCEPPEPQRQALRRYIERRLPATEARRAAEFLGELCGTPFPDDQSPTLSAARQDPALMSEGIQRAFLALLRAEAAVQPVLLVLEDLHWGDALTVRLIDGALRELGSSPLFVLALARPEVEERFPRLWPTALLQVPLRPLSRKSSERLVQEVLGRDVPAEQVRRIVEQAAGNALFLEELIRSAAEGKGDELPPTLLAMLQVRIGRLSLAARRVLMAASVFGDSFRPEGLLALLGTSLAGALVNQHLAELEAAEILLLRSGNEADSGKLYQFRHALLREATYQLLPVEEKIVLHRLAAGYLEKGAGSHLHYQFALDYAGTLPPTPESRQQRIELLFERTRSARGKEPPDVSVQRLHEAEVALKALLAEGHDGAANQKLLLWIKLWLGQMYYLANQQLQAVRFFQEVLQNERSDHQLIALPTSILGQSLTVQGRFADAVQTLEKLVPIFTAGRREQEVLSGLSFLSISLSARGEQARADDLSRKLCHAARDTGNQTLIAGTHGPRIVVHLFGGDLPGAIEESKTAAAAAERAGSALFLYLIFSLRAWAESRCGHHDVAEEYLTRCQDAGKRLGSRLLIADWVAAFRADLALNRGDTAAARALAGGALAVAQASRGLFARGLAQRVIARSLIQEGRLDEAELNLRTSTESFEQGGAVVELEHNRRLREQLAAQRPALSPAP